MIPPDLSIRSVQHYLYCPHRWGLIEIDRAWAENLFVTKANLVHERVHNPKSAYSSPNKKCYTAVTVYNDDPIYNLYGVTDCLEMDTHGKITIVEYKPTKPKDKPFHFSDLMQVFAQKICVDAVFGSNCNGVLYYADVKKRITLPLRENYDEYDALLKSTLAQMRIYLQNGTIPKIPENQYCSGCSFKDLCMPKAKSAINIRKNIEQILEQSE